MPIYEYGCPSCGELFESYKRLSEASDTESCPRCGEKAKKARISLFQAGSSEPPAGKHGCGSGGGKFPFR